MAAEKKSSGRSKRGSDKEEYSAYAHSVNPMITCDVCGEKYPKSEMRQCAKCGMIVCPGCWPQHRCEMDRAPLLKIRRKVERNAAESPAFWQPLEKALQFVLTHKLQVLIGLGILIAVLIVVIAVAVSVGGHDPIEGSWVSTSGDLSISMQINGDGTGTIFTTDTGVDLAQEITWRKVENSEYPYSIAIGYQWYPKGNSRLSEDHAVLTIGADHPATYVKNMVLTMAKVN